jgi:predicted dehydrogenase
MVNAFILDNEWPNGIGNPPDSDPTDPKQWDRWLGPAPKVRYNQNRTFYKFRWFYDYSGGQLTNYGVHDLDMIRWCLGKEYPRRVMAMGGKYVIRDNREIPDTMQVVWEYEGGPLVTFMQVDGNRSPGNIRSAEIALRGTKGTMYLMGGKWEVVPEQVTDLEFFARTPLDRVSERAYRNRKPAMEPSLAGTGPESTQAHARNFLDCVRSRNKCNANVLVGHISTATTLIGNIAHKTGRVLDWDGAKERFTNYDAANSMLEYKYRAPYKLG